MKLTIKNPKYESHFGHRNTGIQENVLECRDTYNLVNKTGDRSKKIIMDRLGKKSSSNIYNLTNDSSQNMNSTSHNQSVNTSNNISENVIDFQKLSSKPYNNSTGTSHAYDLQTRYKKTITLKSSQYQQPFSNVVVSQFDCGHVGGSQEQSLLITQQKIQQFNPQTNQQDSIINFFNQFDRKYIVKYSPISLNKDQGNINNKKLRKNLIHQLYQLNNKYQQEISAKQQQNTICISKQIYLNDNVTINIHNDASCGAGSTAVYSNSSNLLQTAHFGKITSNAASIPHSQTYIGINNKPIGKSFVPIKQQASSAHHFLIPKQRQYQHKLASKEKVDSQIPEDKGEMLLENKYDKQMKKMQYIRLGPPVRRSKTQVSIIHKPIEQPNPIPNPFKPIPTQKHYRTNTLNINTRTSSLDQQLANKNAHSKKIMQQIHPYRYNNYKFGESNNIYSYGHRYLREIPRVHTQRSASVSNFAYGAQYNNYVQKEYTSINNLKVNDIRPTNVNHDRNIGGIRRQDSKIDLRVPQPSNNVHSGNADAVFLNRQRESRKDYGKGRSVDMTTNMDTKDAKNMNQGFGGRQAVRSQQGNERNSQQKLKVIRQQLHQIYNNYNSTKTQNQRQRQKLSIGHQHSYEYKINQNHNNRSNNNSKSMSSGNLHLLGKSDMGVNSKSFCNINSNNISNFNGISNNNGSNNTNKQFREDGRKCKQINLSKNNKPAHKHIHTYASKQPYQGAYLLKRNSNSRNQFNNNASNNQPYQHRLLLERY